MAGRSSRNPDHDPQASEDRDDRDVLAPSDRSGGARRADLLTIPPTGAGRVATTAAWSFPPAAWPGMAGWAHPLDHPMRRDDCADRRPGQGYRHGGPDGGRNLFDKAMEDALSSWFGDDVAQQRRDEGERGRGPLTTPDRSPVSRRSST